MTQQRCTLWWACCDTQAAHCSAACFWGLMDAHSSGRHAASQQYLLGYVEELRCASLSASVVQDQGVLAPHPVDGCSLLCGDRCGTDQVGLGVLSVGVQ